MEQIQEENNSSNSSHMVLVDTGVQQRRSAWGEYDMFIYFFFLHCEAFEVSLD